MPLPCASDRVIDLGATPGGWSYVAASLGAEVLMVDRSEPDAALLRRFPALRFMRGDGLNPPEAELQRATIIMSDMACEPQKLFQSVRRWIKLPELRAMICTLKFHGVSDKSLIREFAALKGAQVYHLCHNGHELTWVWKKGA
jgi:23S rRNA (cytidine2498-2'-O)-methyltransferase